MLSLTFLKLSIKKQAEYKLNFILMCIAVAPINLLQLVFSVVLGRDFNGIVGWGIDELVFLYSVLFITYSIAQIFFRQFRYLDSFIVDGSLDRYFIRPQSITYSIVFNNLSIMEIISQLLPSVILLIYSNVRLKIYWTIKKEIVLMCAIIGGSIIQICIFILIGLISFWTIKSNQLTKVYLNIMNFALYPLDVFGKQIILFLTCVIPLAFINFYPALFILDKQGKHNVAESFITLPISMILLVITYLLWRKALKNYSSTGS